MKRQAASEHPVQTAPEGLCAIIAEGAVLPYWPHAVRRSWRALERLTGCETNGQHAVWASACFDPCHTPCVLSCQHKPPRSPATVFDIDGMLLEACRNGDIQTVQELLEQGANPNYWIDEEKTSAIIHVAAERGHTSIVALLVQYGADLNVKDRWGDNPLLLAIEARHYKTAEYLISQRQLDPNAQNKQGETPFIIVARRGNLNMLKRLIQLGANPFITDFYRCSALHHATQSHQYEVIQYLISELQLDPNAQDWINKTPTMIAAEHGDIEMLKLLIQLGANPHITDPKGQNILHHATDLGQYKTTQYLITQLQLNPNTQDHEGKTPFIIATENGDIKMLRLLTRLGANPHIQYANGRNALHRAAEIGSPKTIRFLITQLQFDPNTKDHQGITPLHIALQNGCIHSTQTLIQLGSNPYIHDTQGRNPLHHAIEQEYRDIAKSLIIQFQLDPNSQDHQGITPLMIAAQNVDIRILQLLIQLGANHYTTDHQGQNALHYAAKRNQTHNIRFLITVLDLNPNSQDHQGNTPLHIALQKGDYETSNTLIQLGANPHIPNHQGQTPAAIAHHRQILLEKPQPSTITL